MEVKETLIKEVFPIMSKHHRIGNMVVPVGEYDEDDPEDKKLASQVPAPYPGFMFLGSLIKPTLLAMAKKHNVLLTGVTGSGKTMLFVMLAQKLNLPLTRLNLNSEEGRPEIIGYLGIPDPSDPEDDGYKMPALVRAIQRPGVVLLDEWDAGRAEVTLCLQRLLEDHQPGLFLVERDEFIPKHPHCFIGATANTRGLGDETGLYAGTQPQNFAQLNRFHVILEMQPPPPKTVKHILEAHEFDGGRTLSKEVLGAMTDFYEAVLAAYNAGNLEAPLSLRSIIHFAEYYQDVGPAAIHLVILQKLPSEVSRNVVLELGKRFKLAS